VKEGQVVCEEYPKPDFLDRATLVWDQLPRRLCVRVPPEMHKGDLPYPYAFLRLTDAVRYGLRPASELPQSERQPKQPSEQQPGKEGVASVEPPAEESMPEPKSETRSPTESPRTAEPSSATDAEDRGMAAVAALISKLDEAPGSEPAARSGEAP